MIDNPYAAPHVAVTPVGESLDATPYALEQLRRMWLCFSGAGCIGVVASVASIVSFVNYARSAPTQLLATYATTNGIALVIAAVIAVVSIKRLRSPGSAAEQLTSYITLLKAGVARIAIQIAALLLPYLTVIGMVQVAAGPPSNVIADMRLWLRLGLAVNVITAIQQAVTTLSTAHMAGAHFVVPQLSYLVARIVGAALYLWMLQAAGAYASSRQSSDFDLLTAAMRRASEVSLVLGVVTGALPYVMNLVG